DVLADDDQPAVLVGQGAVEVDLLDAHAVARALHPQEGAALAVAGGAEDRVAADDRRGDVGGVAAELLVLPQQLAVVGADADDAEGQELDVDADAADLGDDDGGVAGLGPGQAGVAL